MRKSAIVLGVLLLASVACSAWLWTELRAEREHRAALEVRLAAIPRTLPRAAPPVEAPSAALPARPEPAARTDAVATAESATTAGTQAGADRRDWAENQRRLLRDPKYRELYKQQRRLSYAPRRENAIRVVGLTPEQADAVIDLGIDRQLRDFENRGPSSAESPEQRRQREEAEERDYQARIRALVGEEKRARWQEYVESAPTRMRVDQFRAQLSGADALRDDQVEPLIAALHAERTQMDQSLREFRDTLDWEDGAAASRRQYDERRLEQMKAAHARMQSAAAAILSDAQLRRLGELLKRDYDRQEAQLRMSRIRSSQDEDEPDS